MTSKVHFVSLGCPKNRVDTELMMGRIEGAGHQITADADEADVLVVNTCAFIDSAKAESVETILEMAHEKAAREGRRLIVTGCLAQRYAGELEKEIPEVDTFLGTSEIPRILEAIDGVLARRSYVGDGPSSYALSAADPRVNTVRGGTAYLKVSEGCSRSCTFCIIPKIRGRQVSRGVSDIRTEAEMLGRAGVKELVLVAQDMTSFGVNLADKNALARLLRELDVVNGIEWVRLLYMYPWNFSDELLETITNCHKVLPYIDMPLQHISARVLKDMRRNIDRDKQMELIARLRQVPDLVLRTTFITGFPGETDAEFDELYDWVEEVKFDRVGVFAYSKEEDTDAAEMDGQVPDEVKQERRDALMELQQGISLERNRRLVGKTLKVIVDGVSEEHEFVMEGRYYGQAPDIDGVVYLSYDDGGEPATPGSMVDVEIVDATPYDLTGVVLGAEPLKIVDGAVTLNVSDV